MKTKIDETGHIVHSLEWVECCGTCRFFVSIGIDHTFCRHKLFYKGRGVSAREKIKELNVCSLWEAEDEEESKDD